MQSWFLGRARLWRRAGDISGMAALEFAMLLPVMITLFFGVVESTLALLCRADVSIMASTSADLISQADVVAKSDISNVYSAAGAILYPYYDPSTTGSAKPTIRITSVIYDTSTQSTTTGLVAWTCTQSGSGSLTPSSRPVSTSSSKSTVVLPQALLSSGSSVIMAEIAYSYTSPTGKVITGSINFTNNFYTKPRRVAQIAAPSGGCP